MTAQPPPPPPGSRPVDLPPPVGYKRSTNLLEQLGSLPRRMSVRVRLTLLYSGLFFLAGAVLLTVTYVLVERILEGVRFIPRLPPLELSPEEVLNYSEAARSEILGNLLRQSLFALIVVGFVAVILGYFVADRALRPLQQVTATARRLSDRSLAHERIALHGPDDEIKELADTFDAMLERLNTAFDAQRRFVANASHELRTPLAINRTVLEVAHADPEASDDLRVLSRTLLGTNARHERLIEGLLLLARSERELTNTKELDLREVAETVLDQVDDEAGVTLHTSLASAMTTGDSVLLERCVANLVENGVKHNVPEDGEVWVRTLAAPDGAAVVEVENTGPHVPPYEIDDLFEPFRRLHADRVDSARGSGLGLSIVRAVVRAHGGTIMARPRPGGGLSISVRLPRT